VRVAPKIPARCPYRQLHNRSAFSNHYANPSHRASTLNKGLRHVGSTAGRDVYKVSGQFVLESFGKTFAT